MIEGENHKNIESDFAGAFLEMENRIAAETPSMTRLHMRNLGILAIKAVGNVKGALYWMQDHMTTAPSMPMRIGGQFENTAYLDEEQPFDFNKDY